MVFSVSPAYWQAGAFEGVVAVCLALATLSCGAKTELLFGSEDGGEGKEVAVRDDLLCSSSRKGDHN